MAFSGAVESKSRSKRLSSSLLDSAGGIAGLFRDMACEGDKLHPCIIRRRNATVPQSGSGRHRRNARLK
ncbi:MAG: hypothetical protein KZQ76_06810 [Candidatus Thiodiazotropha sp. (ex Epidulcina cf. delphinae)]|nr:hypothetical protein [Candidatus Thiodiazotropha sp. (ex Epidulcina cf. delphinae)]